MSMDLTESVKFSIKCRVYYLLVYTKTVDSVDGAR